MSKSYSVNQEKLSKQEGNPQQEVDISDLDQNVLKVLGEKGPITRSQLVKVTGIPRSTLYDSLFRLILKGLVKKYPDQSHTSRGRPKVFFEVV